MLGLTLGKGEWLTIYHDGEQLRMRLKPVEDGQQRIMIEAPRSFEVIRSGAKVKRIPGQKTKA